MEMGLFFIVTIVTLFYVAYRFARFKKKAKASFSEEGAPLSYDPEYIKAMNDTFKRA